MASTHASLDAASVDRKARLAKLASQKRKQPESETQSGPSVEETDATIQAHNKSDVYLSGRNFDVC